MACRVSAMQMISYCWRRVERAAERLLESSTKYLEETLKLRVNREKSRTVSVFAIRNFKFLGFCFGKNGKGIYIRGPWEVMEEGQG